MNDILSSSGSIQFKNLITSAKDIVPTEPNIVSLLNLVQALTVKKTQ